MSELSDDAVLAMNFVDTINIIQPLWNRFNMGRGANSMTDTELKNLHKCLEHYKGLGGDIAYFTQGAGAPNNCCIC